MGIPGLIQLLKEATTPVHLSKFSGKRVAIDGFSLIYRACYSSSFELNQGINTTFYLRFIDKMIHLLKHHNLEIFFVLDGMGIGHKSGTEKLRSEKKEKNKQKGLQLLASGQASEARKFLKRSLNISPKILSNVIDYIEMLGGVKIMVAPYEADAQIAFLYKQGIVDFAISEDSDLLVYGCDSILLKITDKGYGTHLSIGELANDKKKREDTVKDKAAQRFIEFGEENRIHVALLAGNDYKAKVKGLGLKSAVEMVELNPKFEDLVAILMSQGRFELQENFKEHTEEVFKIFRYQRVYNPKTKCLDTLNPLPKDWKASSDATIGPKFENVEDFVSGKLDLKHKTVREKKTFTRDEIMKKPDYGGRQWKRRSNQTHEGYCLTEEEELAQMLYDAGRKSKTKPNIFDDELRKMEEDEEMDEINARIYEETPGLTPEEVFGFLYDWDDDENSIEEEKSCGVLILERSMDNKNNNRGLDSKNIKTKEEERGRCLTDKAGKRHVGKFEDNLSFFEKPKILLSANTTPVKIECTSGKSMSKPNTPLFSTALGRDGEARTIGNIWRHKIESKRHVKKFSPVSLLDKSGHIKKENVWNSNKEPHSKQNPASEQNNKANIVKKSPIKLSPMNCTSLETKINEKRMQKAKKSPYIFKPIEKFFTQEYVKSSTLPPTIDLDFEPQPNSQSGHSPVFGEQSIESDFSEFLDKEYASIKKRSKKPSKDILRKLLKTNEDSGVYELKTDQTNYDKESPVFSFFCFNSNSNSCHKQA